MINAQPRSLPRPIMRGRHPSTRPYELISTRLLLNLVLLIICLASWAGRLPARLIAQPENVSASFTSFLQQADQAINQNLWHQAVVYFERALPLADPALQSQVEQRLQWCRLNANLDECYRDGSFVRWVRTIEPPQARILLAEALQYAWFKYYQKPELSGLLEKALRQLQAAAANPMVGAQQQLDEAALAEMKNLIVFDMEDDVSALSLTFDKPLMESLCEFSEQTGLGSSWAVVELAYALINSLDEYSYILSPLQYEQFTARLDGSYRGVGVDLIFERSLPAVFDVVPGSPAARAGLLPGDFLICIDGVDLENKSSFAVGNLLAKGENQSLALTVMRENQQLQFILQRELLHAPSVRYVQLLGSEKKTGYLRVANFDNDTAYEMRRALSQLQNRHAESIVIDLRSNGGGVLLSAVDAVRLFLKQGLIVTVNSASGATVYRAQNDGFACCDLPLAVLVDSHTASAAEIFVAALKDHHRAVIVGGKTHGKALVQTLYRLDNAPTALCLTTASYLPPGSYDFNGRGISPDLMVESCASNRICSMNFLLSDDDPALHQSLAYLKNK